MNRNYTYIIASCPALAKGAALSADWCEKTLDWIESQLDGPDRNACRFVRDGFIPSKLDREFYTRAFAKGSAGFVKDYFAVDLALRNVKAEYLNRKLGRAVSTDTIEIEDAPQIEEKAALESIFTVEDLFERERRIDEYMWDTADTLCRMKDFSLDCVLAIVVKISIICRWSSLDEATGRQMLEKLVNDTRGTYGKIEFSTFR